MGNPCRDRNGVVWPSQSACARAHGISPSAVSQHLETHGNLDRMGCGMWGKNIKSAKSKPFVVDGRHWASHSELARVVGVNRLTVGRWLRHNRLDRIRAALEAAQ